MPTVIDAGVAGDERVVCDRCLSTVAYHSYEAKRTYIGYKGAKSFYSYSIKCPNCGHHCGARDPNEPRRTP